MNNKLADENAKRIVDETFFITNDVTNELLSNPFIGNFPSELRFCTVKAGINDTFFKERFGDQSGLLSIIIGYKNLSKLVDSLWEKYSKIAKNRTFTKITSDGVVIVMQRQFGDNTVRVVAAGPNKKNTKLIATIAFEIMKAQLTD